MLCVHHYQRQEKYKDIRRAASEIFQDFLNPSAVSNLVTMVTDLVVMVTVKLFEEITMCNQFKQEGVLQVLRVSFPQDILHEISLGKFL